MRLFSSFSLKVLSKLPKTLALIVLAELFSKPRKF